MSPWCDTLQVAHPLLATHKFLLQPQMPIHLWKLLRGFCSRCYKCLGVDPPRCFRQCMGKDRKSTWGHQLFIGVFWVYLFLHFKNKIFRSAAMVQWWRVLIALSEDPIQFPASRLGGSLTRNFRSRGSGDLFWTVQGHAPACTKPHFCKHIDTSF